jgi:hypothetical protein
MAQPNNGNSNTLKEVSNVPRRPQPKPGLRVKKHSTLRRMRRSVGGTIAYLASWWRY